MMGDDECGVIGGMFGRGNLKSCPSAALSTTNPSSSDPGSNLGSRGKKAATNSVSYCLALQIRYRVHSPISSIASISASTPTAYIFCTSCERIHFQKEGNMYPQYLIIIGA
jgi:hypothetical protein